MAVKPEIVIKWDRDIRKITRAAGLSKSEVEELEQKLIKASGKRAVEDNATD